MAIKKEKVQQVDESQQDPELEERQIPSQEETQSGQGQWE